MKTHDPTQQAGHRRLFEETVDGLDQATSNRLRLMRRDTLAARPASPARRLLPVAAIALAALALGLSLKYVGNGAPVSDGLPVVSQTTVPADLAPDLSSDEDTALYAWLGEAPVAADSEAL
jgi:hypothetical protein